MIEPLELQTALTSGIGERLNASVVTKARTVKGNLLNPSRFSTFGNCLTDGSRSRHIARVPGKLCAYGLI